MENLKQNPVKSNKPKFKMPHTYVILFSIILVASIASYIVPAGHFDTIVHEVTGKNIVDPDTFQFVEQSPISFFDIFKSIPKGMKAGSSIIFFIFIVGGAFEMLTDTGAIEAGINRTVKNLAGREVLMIPVFVLIFGLGGATFGMAEETLIFVPIGIMLARKMGYDALVGTGMVTLGAAVGFNSGFMNPFTVGVAQGIAELPLFSGITLRISAYAIFYIITVLFLMNYAKKVKADPKSSLVYDLELNEKHKHQNIGKLRDMTSKDALVLTVLFGGLLVIAYGVMKFGWYITEIAAAFIIIGMVGGLIGGKKPSQLADSFVKGAKGLVFGALVVGVARGILVVLQDGQIIDTLIYALSSLIKTLPSSVTAVGMFITQIVINFFIPSGSGQAAATMPIMVPLSDIVGVTRQTAVLAYQFGDGFTNSIIPTSSVLMAYLSIANIPYNKWVRFVYPLILIWVIAGCTFIIFANATTYGPF